METKSLSRLKLILALMLAAALLLAAGAWFLHELRLRGGSPADETPPDADEVLRVGSRSVDNTVFGYYYWSEFFYLRGAAEEYLSGQVDFDRPLAEQSFDGEHSWEDYLLDCAFTTIAGDLSMVQRAKETGFELPEESRASLEQVLANFETFAARQGFYQADGSADVEAYLRDSYGSGAALETFRTYLEDAYLASSYADYLYDSIVCTPEEVRDYFRLHAQDYPASTGETSPEVQEDLRQERYRNLCLAIEEAYPLQVDRSKIVLTSPAGLYEN